MSYVKTVIATDETTATDVDLLLPRTATRKLNIPSALLTVTFGSQSIKATVKGVTNAKVARINPVLAQTLHLPTGIPLLLRYNAKHRQLVFGPFIGILLSQRYKNGGTHPFGMYTSFVNEVANVCRVRGGIVCAFDLDDVNWETKTVRGMIRQNGVWKMRTLPLPQCIYNRLSSRHEEMSSQTEVLIRRCRELQIPFFNEQFLDKWNVHTILSTGQDALSFLPKTLRYQSAQELKHMLKEFRFIYAKPANGSMGKGIWRIHRSPDGYKLHSANGAGKRCKDFPTLKKTFDKQINGKPYLLQQGLSLIGVNRRPVDFRVLVQKNGSGEWDVTSLVARLGQNRVVSNISRGGSMLSAVRALRICGPFQTGLRPSVQRLKSVSLLLARTLDQSLPGHYAEFGIDLGVDVSGKIWLLEINSKPSKSDNTLQVPEGEEHPRRRIRPSVKRLVEYSSFLGGFSSSRKPNPKRKASILRKNRR